MKYHLTSVLLGEGERFKHRVFEFYFDKRPDGYYSQALNFFIGDTQEEVLQALQLCAKELETRIEEAKKCP